VYEFIEHDASEGSETDNPRVKTESETIERGLGGVNLLCPGMYVYMSGDLRSGKTASGSPMPSSRFEEDLIKMN
jgi:hypothetical protein